MPVEELGFNLNKEQFWDALKLRYGIKLENLPAQCPCGQPFDVSHALSCKKGGFIVQRHDNIKNLLVSLLAKVCKNVESEPHLLEITSESLNYATANTSDEARLDIKAQGFWQHGQVTYFDVRVTQVNAASQKQQPTAKIFRQHEQAKKREYLERVLRVQQGSFTPLIFGTNGGLGEECQTFLKNLAKKIANQEDESYADILTWLRTRLSFECVKSALACVRGSRTPFRKQQDELRDFELMNRQGDVSLQ